MGFAASQARYLMLTARKSDLELQGQFINQARIQLANMMSNLFTNSANLSPQSPEVRRLMAQISAIQQIDKGLELQLRRVDTQREAVQTEIEAVRKVIATNIQSTFKTFA
jgi:capsule polysaccharide export protein KpsE/RkpR